MGGTRVDSCGAGADSWTPCVRQIVNVEIGMIPHHRNDRDAFLDYCHAVEAEEFQLQNDGRFREVGESVSSGLGRFEMSELEK